MPGVLSLSDSLFRILALYISTLLRSDVCRNSVGESFIGLDI